MNTSGAPPAPDAPDAPATSTALDRERIRNFAGLAIARVGPRAFEVVHGTFLTLFVGARTGSAFMVALALTAHRLLSWLVWPVAGRVSDATKGRLGRRAPYLGGGLVVMGVATWTYTVVGGYWPLLATIVIARTANTGRQLASIAVVPETFGRSRWIRALVATFLAGTVVSLSVRVTVIATWKEDDPATWNIAFRMAAVLMVLAGLAVLALVRDGSAARKLAERATRSEPWRQRIGEILEVPNAKLLLASLFLTVAASGATVRLVPLFYREELGAGAAEQSTALIVAAVAGLVISLPAGVRLTRLLGRRQLAVLGPLTAGVGAFLHLFVTDIWQTVAIGVVTGAFGVGLFLATIAMLLQLLPRSGGMGERVGLAAGPAALVGVLSTYAAALAVDVAGNYRVMWLFPTVLGLINAALLSRLWIPPWAAKVDVRASMLRLTRRPGARRGQPQRQRRGSSLFAGEVDVDDADASVIFEVLRHALGNPYTPPRRLDLDEPAAAITARRVITVGDAPDSAEVAAVAALIADDAVLVEDGTAYRAQPAVIERLTATSWRPWDRDAYGTWKLAAASDGEATFQAAPPPRTGEIDITVHLDHGRRGDTGDAVTRVTRIERETRPTLAQQADAHARDLGYPVPTPVTLDLPNAKGRRRRALLTFWVIGRHLGGVIVRRLLRRPIQPLKVARGLRKVFERLGAGYVKFGQLVASSPSIFGEDVADEFRTTLDSGPIVAAKQVRSLIEAELGRPFAEVFSALDPHPLGRASIAVVHRATTVDGREVAVKVIRPGIDDILATDLALMEPLFLRIAGPAAARLAGPLLQMLEGFRRQVSEELDLRNEAEAMAHYRRLLADIDLPGVVVPEPYRELTSQRVLTMELLDGVAIDDISAIEAFGVDPAPLLEQVVKAWFVTAILHGTFHGDVHAGNLMLLRDGRVALIDWGIVARLDPATHGFFRHLIAGALGQEAAWDEIAVFFGEMFGPLLARADLDASRLAELFRPRIEAVLTQPFGQMSLGALISDNQREAAEADGEVRLRRRRGRGLRSQPDEPREPMRTPPFNRGLFLLGKQLMYFERYGRMYLSDVALLHDRGFFTELVGRAESSAADTG